MWVEPKISLMEANQTKGKVEWPYEDQYTEWHLLAIHSWSFLTLQPCCQSLNQPSMLLQVADVDTGVIKWVNADLLTHMLPRI